MTHGLRAIERRPRSRRSSSRSTSTAPAAPTSPPASASTTTCSTAFARHALVDLTVQTEGDTHIDAHHTVEDTAIVLGQALREALGDKAGIRRFGDATVPLDEALVQAVVDVSGRPYCVHTGEPEGQQYVLLGGGDYLGSLTRHVFETIAFHAHLALHVRVLAGRDPHHIVEAQFKAFARAFRDAVAHRPARDGRAVDQGCSLSARAPRRRPRLRLGQPPLRRARARARRRRGHADRRLRRRRWPPTAWSSRASARTPPAWPACARSRASGSSAAGSPAAARCSGSASGMQVLFERGVEHGVETEGCDEWPGVVERLQAPVVPHMGWNTVDVARGQHAVRRRRGRAVLLRALLRRARLDAGDQRPHPGAAGDLGRARRRPVRRGRRERPADRDPVPPREVRRRRRRAAAQLGRADACRDEQGARPAPARAGARGRRGRPPPAPPRPSGRRRRDGSQGGADRPGSRSGATGPSGILAAAAAYPHPALLVIAVLRRSTCWSGSSVR